MRLKGHWSPKGGLLEAQGSLWVAHHIQGQTDIPLTGTIIGTSSLRKTKRGPLLEAQLQSSNLKIFEQAMGHASMQLSFDFQNALKFEALIDSAHTALSLKGKLTRDQRWAPLSLSIRQMPLRMLSPLIAKDFSHISGTLDGDLTLSGYIYNPDIEGLMEINQGRARFDYMQTDLYYQGTLKLSGKKVLLENLKVADEFEQPITLRGMIVHHGFNVPLEVFASVSLDNVHVLNTYTLPPDGKYYGQAYVSGDLSVRGTPEDLYFSGQISSQPGTYIYGLYTDEETTTSFIEFVESSSKPRARSKTDTLDRTLSYTLDIAVDNSSSIALISSPDEDPALVFSGQGRIDVERTRAQDYIFHGNLQLSDGKYSFSSGFLQKKFDILFGSSLSWQGDPTQPNLALSMQYRAQVSTAPIATFSTTASSSNTYIDAQVDMYITGDLLQPILTFDLNIPDNDQTHNFLQYLATNPEEKRRQIINLLLFNRFAPVASFGLGASDSQRDALVSNLDDALLTTFVNEFLAELDERLLLDIDLARQTMSVSYSFMQGRLQLLQETRFTQTQQSQNDPLSILGIWNIDYALSRQKNWYLRAYFDPRNTQRIIGNNAGGRVSLRHSQRFGHIFRRKRPKKHYSTKHKSF